MRTFTNMVLSGGGLQGFAILGAMERFDELDGKHIKVDVKNILGVSIGAIIGLLYAIGYNAKELIGILVKKDFQDLTSISMFNILTRYGLDNGDKITQYLNELLEKKRIKNNITFSELYKLKDIRLRIATTNLDRNSQVIFDYTNYPDMPIIQAARMSYSVPFIFNCVEFQDCIYVDGGLSDNYPIELYEDVLEQTFGVQLVTDDSHTEVNSFQKYTNAIIKCLRIQLQDKPDNIATVNIKADKISSSVNFGINTDEKKELVYLGYSECTRFFDAFI